MHLVRKQACKDIAHRDYVLLTTKLPLFGRYSFVT